MSAPLVISGVIAGIAIAAVSTTAAHQYSSQPEYAQVLYVKPAMRSVAVSRQDSKMQQVGYDVAYLLDGQERELRMNYIPDSRIPVVDGQLVLKN